MSENVTIVSESTFDAEVLQSPLPVLVDFWAEWCGPCKMLAPTIEKLAVEYAGRARFAKVNVDENRGMGPRFGFRGIPALILFKDGKEVDRAIGWQDEARLTAMVAKAL